MKPIEVLIVDDEPIARDILETFVSKIPGLHIAGMCKNAIEAFAAINKGDVDILLTDIDMPEISGIDFLNSLRNPPLVIFTTAHSEYALESYNLDAVDYLVKPISFDRFLKAMNKAINIVNVKPVNVSAAKSVGSSGEQIMFVKTSGKLQKVDLEKLWMIEALKDYLKLYVDKEKIVIHSTMKNMEDQLSQMPQFLRVNKSYIVNVRFVDEIEGNIISIKGTQVPIGNTYKQEVLDYFDRLRL